MTRTQKQVEWFENVFLFSLIKKALNNPNPKYKNCCLISEKQFDICQDYMTARTCENVTRLGHSIHTIFKYEADCFLVEVKPVGKWYKFFVYDLIPRKEYELKALYEALEFDEEEYQEDLNNNNLDWLEADLKEIEKTKAKIEEMKKQLAEIKKAHQKYVA